MVKGVNKTIIEINETGNKVFDRVLLFVNPDKAYSDSVALKKEALDYIKGLSPDFNTGFLRQRIKRRKQKRLLLGILVGFTLILGVSLIFIFNIL